MKKRALLINPWIYDFAAYDFWSKPMGLLTIGGELKRQGIEVHLIDCLDRHDPYFQKRFKVKEKKFGTGKYYFEPVSKPTYFQHLPLRYKRYGLPEAEFARRLKAFPRPDAVLITSGMTYWYPGVFEAIALVKERLPGVPIILGGIFATLCPDFARRNSGADLVLTGRPREGFWKALSRVLDRHLEAGGETPVLFDLYPRITYLTIFTSFGCPFQCPYCGAHLLQPRFQEREPDGVMDDIIRAVKHYRIRDVAFFDDALLVGGGDRFEQILDGIINNYLDLNLHSPNGIHPRFVTEGLARKMKRAGFKTIRMGLETWDEELQSKLGGKVTGDEVERAVAYLKHAGFQGAEIGVYVMGGLPEFSVEEIRKTVKLVHGLGVQVRLAQLSPVPGTPVFDRLKESFPFIEEDPLTHNNTTFIYNVIPREEWQGIKGWVKELNAEVG
ncbi:radical SAM protein [candidate division KSB1 bacterium]|nr:radical SAM protein [candidate division KSB1 bacterium]